MSPPPVPEHFRPAPLRMVVGRTPLATLVRLKRLMAAEGWPLDLPRMGLDRFYAQQCLALAHTSADEDLRDLALQVFQDYEQGPLLRAGVALRDEPLPRPWRARVQSG